VEEYSAMNLADQMLLAQLRESALQSVPDDQWNLVLNEVEKAGGVRQVQGYAKTLLHDAIAKASFEGNRSDAGRYAANVRWQGQGKADRANSGKRVMNYGSDRKGFNEWSSGDASEPSATVGNLKSWIKAGYLDRDNLSDTDSKRLSPTAPKEELKEGNIADELPNAMPPLYNDYGDEPVNPMPPEYNDYGDEPTDTQRAGRKLMRMAVPLDIKNPEKSRVKTSPRRP